MSIEALGDQIANLKLSEAAALKEYLKEKYKIEPAGGGVMVDPPPTKTEGAAKPVEANEVNVVIEAGFAAAKKANIIKAVRDITGWSLMDCKAAVEGAPKAVKENVDKKTSYDLKKKLEEAGAKVSVKPAG